MFFVSRIVIVPYIWCMFPHNISKELDIVPEKNEGFRVLCDVSNFLNCIFFGRFAHSWFKNNLFVRVWAYYFSATFQCKKIKC